MNFKKIIKTGAIALLLSLVSFSAIADDIIIKTGGNSCPKFIQTYTSSGNKTYLYEFCKVGHLTGPDQNGDYKIAGSDSYTIKSEQVQWLKDNGYFVPDLTETQEE